MRIMGIEMLMSSSAQTCTLGATPDTPQSTKAGEAEAAGIGDPNGPLVSGRHLQKFGEQG